MVKMRKDGEMKTRSIKIFVILPPLFTISSINLRILSIRRMRVNIIKPMKKTGVISLRI
jgi:hypothetical protein